MNSKDILAINLKYYRKKYHLSQEKLAEYVGSTIEYICQLENGKRNPSIGLLDQFAKGLNKIPGLEKLSPVDLITYDKSHLTNYKRIDEKTDK